MTRGHNELMRVAAGGARINRRAAAVLIRIIVPTVWRPCVVRILAAIRSVRQND